MMSREWTDAQRKAINSRNGSVLVSAAAGSGKTAVLVERVIQRIIDKNNPTNEEVISRILEQEPVPNYSAK